MRLLCCVYHRWETYLRVNGERVPIWHYDADRGHVEYRQCVGCGRREYRRAEESVGRWSEAELETALAEEPKGTEVLSRGVRPIPGMADQHYAFVRRPM